MFLKQYIETNKQKSSIQFDDIDFVCPKCKTFDGQFQFETKMMSANEYAIVVKGFDHKEQSLVLVIYKYCIITQSTTLLKKVNLAKAQVEDRCISCFYASHV